MLRLRPQQPGQRGDANPQQQKRIGRARDNVVNLAQQRNVGQEQAGADEVQRFARLAVFALRFAQPPTAAVRAQQEQNARGDFHAARNFVPVRGDEQDDSRRDEHRADNGNDGEEFVPAILLEMEAADDLPLLLIADEAGLANFLNVGVFHGRPGIGLAS